MSRHHRSLACILALAAVALLGSAVLATAADLYVAPDGQGQYATIADAVAAATHGDTVWLEAGVYAGPGNRDVSIYRDITIRAADWPEPTVIDCEAAPETPRRAFVVEYCDAAFVGLTIKGGHHATGGAMTIEEGSPTIERCEFRGNHADTHGGAIHAFEAAQVTCERSIFARNRAGTGGGAIHADGEAQVTLSRCTLVTNGAPSGGHVHLAGGGATVIDRSLLVFACEGAAVSDDYSPHATVTCSDVYGNRGGDWTATLQGLGGQDGNIAADPLLADPMGDQPDDRLTVGTPAWSGSDDCSRMGAVIFDGLATAPIYGLEPDGSGMFATVQDAMDGIPAGAVIELALGTFEGIGNVGLNPQGKAMTVRTRPNANDLEATLWMGGDLGISTLLTLDSGEGADTVFDDVDFHAAMRGRILQITGPVGARFVGCGLVNGVGDGGAALIAGEPEAPATVAFEDCNINHNYSYLEGCGGIRASHWQVGLTDVRFINDVSYGGPAALDLASCSGQITGCIFENGDGHTAVHVADLPGDSLRLLGCDFQANAGAFSADLTADLAGELILDNCTFTDGQGQDRGGSLRASGTAAGASLVLADCHFTAPADVAPCAEGGAIAVDGLALTMSGCTVTGWRANGDGGGLQAQNCTLDLLECRFEENLAGADGGAIHLVASDAVIAETGVLDCEADEFGGGLFVASGAARLELGRITGCIADRGGAIAAHSSLASILVDAEHMLIADNSVNEFGAALWLNGADVSAELQQCTIHANEQLNAYEAGQLYTTVNATIDAQHCLITGSATTSAAAGPAVVTAYCCDVWGNAGGDWAGPLAGQLGQDENVSVDPLHCDAGAGDYRVAANSICLPDNNACATQIGARGQGCTAPVGVVDAPTVATATLAPACPNPFNPRTVLAYDLPRATTVQLAVFDLRGQRVRTLCRGERREAGRHEVAWLGDDDHGRGLAAGIYLVRLQAGGETAAGRVALVR